MRFPYLSTGVVVVEKRLKLFYPDLHNLTIKKAHGKLATDIWIKLETI